jgi:phosphonate transport system permease protein
MSDATLAMEPAAPRRWQRFSRLQRLLRYGVTLFVVWAVVQSVRKIQIIPEFLNDAPEQMADMLRRMWPVDWSHYMPTVHEALLETLHMATLGTLASLLLAVPLGLMAAENVTHSRVLNHVARVVLVASRSVNSLVWALLFVAIFGPGPLAGTCAIAFRSVGFVGKLLGEAIEQSPRGPIEALQAAGATKSAQIWYGHWPHVKPAFWATVLLRWDINVRESGVLGLVGAGGIGVALDTSLNLFHWTQVSMILVAVFAVVVAAEIVVAQVRRRLLG